MNDARLEDYPALAAARDRWKAGGRDGALSLYEAALADRPDNVRGLLEAGRAFASVYDIARAESLIGRVEALAGGDRRILAAVAEAYTVAMRPQKAVAAFARLASAGPLEPAAMAKLAELYEQMNQIGRALAMAAESAERSGGRPEPLVILARLKRRSRDLDGAMADARQAAVSAAPSGVRAHAWAELCHVHDARGEFDEAVAAIERAKSLIKADPAAERLSRQAVANNQALGRLYQSLDRDTLNRWAAAAPPLPGGTGGVGHLIGFPRSGTTLLEQALGAHPGLADAPERSVFFRDVFPALHKAGGPSLSKESLDAVPADALAALRERYLARHEAILGEPLAGRVLLDKNPNHTSLAAALFRLFPESRVLFALRDPRDVVVSCYMRLFTLSEFSACFLTWGSTCYLYGFEMTVWLKFRELITGHFVEIKYEDTVRDLEGQARKSLDALNLPWDAAVMSYRESGRHKVVNSPSHAEVRRPVYGNAVGRWRNYEKYLGPYLDRLAPFLRAFGYD